ncbi:hypothetical protein C8J56DRAFT_1168269 [Mycena floridula]|nr:hypothetical protein C8J56DRAFT_1168269 [Mycena floridula]
MFTHARTHNKETPEKPTRQSGRLQSHSPSPANLSRPNPAAINSFTPLSALPEEAPNSSALADPGVTNSDTDTMDTEWPQLPILPMDEDTAAIGHNKNVNLSKVNGEHLKETPKVNQDMTPDSPVPQPTFGENDTAGNLTQPSSNVEQGAHDREDDMNANNDKDIEKEMGEHTELISWTAINQENPESPASIHVSISSDPNDTIDHDDNSEKKDKGKERALLSAPPSPALPLLELIHLDATSGTKRARTDDDEVLHQTIHPTPAAIEFAHSRSGSPIILEFDAPKQAADLDDAINLHEAKLRSLDASYNVNPKTVNELIPAASSSKTQLENSSHNQTPEFKRPRTDKGPTHQVTPVPDPVEQALPRCPGPDNILHIGTRTNYADGRHLPSLNLPDLTAFLNDQDPAQARHWGYNVGARILAWVNGATGDESTEKDLVETRLAHITGRDVFTAGALITQSNRRNHFFGVFSQQQFLDPLLDSQFITSEGIYIGFRRINDPPPSHIGVIVGLVPVYHDIPYARSSDGLLADQAQPAVQDDGGRRQDMLYAELDDILVEIIRSQPIVSVIIQHIDRSSDNRALQEVVDTMATSINIQPTRVNTAQDSSSLGYAIAIHHPAVHTGYYPALRAAFVCARISTSTSGRGRVLPSLFLCDICGSTDHITGFCHLPNYIGWQGPTLESIAAANRA